MTRTLCLLLLFAGCLNSVHTKAASSPDTAKGWTRYAIPDTTKGIGFYQEVKLPAGPYRADTKFTVLGFSKGAISFAAGPKQKTVSMQFDNAEATTFTAAGAGVITSSKNVRTWVYEWRPGTIYKLLLTALPDSASRTTIYAGYLFLPEKQQWKLIASAKSSDDGDFLRGLYTVHRDASTLAAIRPDSVNAGNAWLQRSNGSWFEFKNPRPVVDLTRNADSMVQAQLDRAAVYKAVRDGKIDTSGSRDGVYYHILKQGTGRMVSVDDTVTVFYKGYLLADGTVFDQTKDKPAVFPLRRLIKGWQIAIPMCRTGGTVRVIIPAGLAYGIRARSKDIPPNSVLVFDIDVVDAKKPG